jgi:methylphosphotriester-DNA--protein-cysteine methyltransferase
MAAPSRRRPCRRCRTRAAISCSWAPSAAATTPSLRARLARELGDLAGKLVVQSAGKLFRVQLGPWPDAAAAQRAGADLREILGMAPVVVQR